MNKLNLVDYLSVYQDAIKKGKNQQLLTTFLREHKWHFVAKKILEKTKLKIWKKHQHYEFMVLVRDHANLDKIDTFLAFGIQLSGKRNSTIVIYLNNNYYTSVEVPITKGGLAVHNFKKPHIAFKFPKWMDYQDRKHWRYEYFKLQKNPNYKPKPIYSDNIAAVKLIEKKK